MKTILTLFLDRIRSSCFRMIPCAMIPFLAFALAGCGQKQEGAGAVPKARPVAEITNQTGLVMLLIPAGSFAMGDERGDDDEMPVRQVQLDAFLMDKYEVTQKVFASLTGKSPSHPKHKGDDKPADQVSWADAAAYCNLRSMKEGLDPCYDAKTLTCNFDANGYRLPTEAEWEYACRAGTAARYSFGSQSRDLDRHGWSKENSVETTHPVGQKTPNPWGLCDMHGNIAEWCHDFYAEDAYKSAETKNPRGPAKGSECVIRGGSWSVSADSCRSASRASAPPKWADVCVGSDSYGFRCVRKPPASP